jgi:hypothetical protein
MIGLSWRRLAGALCFFEAMFILFLFAGHPKADPRVATTAETGFTGARNMVAEDGINYCAPSILFGSNVKSATPRTLDALISGARAGDVIALEDGTYTDGFTLTSDGTQSSPIVVRARNPGGVRFEGTRIALEGAYNVLACFRLHDTYVRIGSADDQGKADPRGEGSRITRNWVTHTGDSRFAVINVHFSKYARIDHNDIGDANNDFRHTAIRIKAVENSGQRIDHNHIHGSPNISGKEYEAIWMQPDYSRQFAKPMEITVDHNLFENWHGDNEVIAVKGSHNYIVNNTFLNSRDLSLRSGGYNLVKNNVFDNAGVVTFGLGHSLIGNRLESNGQIRVRGGRITYDGHVNNRDQRHVFSTNVMVVGTVGGTIIVGEPPGQPGFDRLHLPPKGTKLGNNSSKMKYGNHIGTVTNYSYSGHVGAATGVTHAQVGPNAPSAPVGSCPALRRSPAERVSPRLAGPGSSPA